MSYYLETFDHCAEKDFRAKAFAEYCEKRAENFQRMFQALTAVIDKVPDEDPELRSRNLLEEATQAADEVIEDLGLVAEERLALDSGFVSIKNLLIEQYLAVEGDIKGSTDYGSYIDCFYAVNSAGQPANLISINTAVDEMKASYHAACSTAAALFASYGESVSEKLSLFRDRLNEKFQNAFSDYSSVATCLTDALRKNFSPTQMFDHVKSLLQINKLTTENPAIVNDTDFSQYSGASPICALCFDNVIKAGVSVVTATVKVVAGVIGAIGAAVGKVFSWIGSKIHQIVVDPYDLDEIDSKEQSHTIDGFQWQTPQQTAIITPYSVGLTGQVTETLWNSVYDNISSSKVGTWIKYKTVFSEHLFRIDEVSMNWDEDYPDFSSISVKYIEVYKLKPITREAVNSFLLTKTALTQEDAYTVKAVLDTSDISNTGFDGVSQIYYNTGDSEHNLFKGFCYSAFLMRFLTSTSVIADKGSTNTLSLTDPISNFIDDSAFPSNITNRAFIYAACGYNFGTGDITTEFLPWLSDNIMRWIYSSNIQNYGLYYYFGAFVENLALEYLDPINFPFLPYINGSEGFDAPRFTIKTDSQNQAAFKKFATIVIVVAVIAVVAISATVIAKKIARRIKINRIAAQGRMDNAMWNGETLDNRQARKYFRLVRKNSSSGAVTSGLLSNTFESLTNNTNGTENFSEIIDILK